MPPDIDEPTLELTDQPPDDARELIIRLLTEQIDKALGPRMKRRPLAILVRDPATGDVLGGLWGHTGHEWLFVELLALPPAMRRRGLGRRLLAMAEREAVARGCHSAWLDTSSFQAPAFYEMLGWRRFGQLDGFPGAHFKAFYSKRLGPPS
jgi:GNAT superfamily N-acetyltransferase